MSDGIDFQPVGSSDGIDFQPMAQPKTNAVQAAATGAMNNIPLGGQIMAGVGNLTDKIAHHFNPDVPAAGYSGELEQFKNDAKTAKAEHPVAYGAGAVGGTLAPLAVPGVGEALEASPILGNAALGAANAVSDVDVAKNPGEAAKDAALGAGIGWATAGILGKVLPSSGGMEEASNRLANKSVGYAPGILSSMTPEEQQANGAFLKSAGLVGKDKQEILKHAKGLMDEYGNKIGEIGQATEKGGIALDPDTHYAAVQKLSDKAQEYGNSKFSDGMKLARSYKQAAAEVNNLPTNASWSDIQGLKERTGKLAFDSKGEIKNPAIADTYFALKDMLSDMAQKAQADPNLPGEYKEALANYSKLHPIVNGLEKSLDAELRGHSGNVSGVLHPGKLIAQMPGKARAVLGAGAALMGHPYIGAAAALPEVMNPAIQSKAASAIGQAAPTIQSGATQGLTKEVMDFIRRKYQ